jgi:uncharacterized membrane protein
MMLLLLACAAAESAVDPMCVDSPVVTWEGWAHGFVTTWCLGCHSAQNTDWRFDAPEGVNFDTEADTYAWADRIRVRVLDEQTMPVAGGLSDDDRVLLDLYLSCTLVK